MSRRVSLPGAAELFRVTGDDPTGSSEGSTTGSTERGAALPQRSIAAAAVDVATADRADERADEHAAASDAVDLRVRRDGDYRSPGQRGGPSDRRDGREPDDPASDLVSQGRPVRRRVRAGDRQPTGRERHDEKITVYCSPEELLDLEHARLTLRGDFGLAVDRGRIVREAMAVVLADLDAKGESSILVRRLRGRA